MNKNCFGKMHYCLAIILFFFISASAQAQGSYNTTNWKFSNPKQFGFTIFDVDFFDNNNVIAVGSDGGIAKSTDGGANWKYGGFTYVANTGLTTKTTFNDVHYITANIAYAVGSGGCMAKTTDGGLTWSFVNTPLFANAKNINALWFVDQNKGYIGGQWNTADSIPKVYFTNNGGATWDSLVSPTGGKTRVGYVNNANLPPLIWDITGKGKEIQRIEFSSPATGFIIGGGQTHFPPVAAANGTTCLPTGAFTSTSANNAALVWRITNGVLTDYSLSKERLGYSGIVTNTISCTTSFNAAQITPVVQTYRAINVINDSLVIIMSSNNNTVVRIHTGRYDSTLNLATGLKEAGRYQIMNYPNPPTQGPQAGPPIPAVQTLIVTNPYHIRRAANGKLFATSGSGTIGPLNRMFTSVDTGRTWVWERNLPSGRNYSEFSMWALDIAPNGKFLAMGLNGAVSDSSTGSTWGSNYISVPVSVTHLAAEFADCNNGILAGGSSITVTTDGGATWADKARPDFTASNYSINGIAYPNTAKAYFAVSNGVVYFSSDKGTTLDPVYSNFNFQMNGVAAVGNDSIWAVGYNQFSIPAASRTSSVFRSFDSGVTWNVVGGFPIGTTAPNLSKIAFPSRQVGYIAGSRNAVYKTTDAGATWTSINPFPSLNEGPTGFPNAFIQYQEIVALDDNTVFLVGNMFTSTGIKRVYKTTNGGTTWTDITGNLSALLPVGNLIGLTMHDASNGYVTAGSALFKTNDGGATWTMDVAPTNSLFETMSFAPRKVPTSISMANRKLFVSGIAAPTSNASIMEYGDPANIAVNSTETITNVTCTNLSGGSITINATGAIAPYSYSINGGAFQSSSTFTGLTQGPKTIIIKDSYCGTITKTITVGFTDNLTLTTNNDTTVCAGAPVQMRATSAAATYAWTPAGGLSASNISNPVATVNSNAAFTVTASLNGCVRTKTVNITIKPNPIINAGPDKTIVDGDEVMLEGTATAAVSIAWTPTATLTNANTLSPVAKPNTTTAYTLTVRDNNNCTSTDIAIVNVIPYCVKIMNAFTPNGDGLNDRWQVTNGAPCSKEIQVAVYNRYGNVIYTNSNYSNDWDGTFKGKPVADGTYYYAVTFRTITGKLITLKGDVTILR
jgi:gliding motility-associated-like protein